MSQGVGADDPHGARWHAVDQLGKALQAIEAALIHALKTGEGQLIDMALLDVQSAVLANQNMNYLISGKPPVRLGNAHPNISPYEVVPTADGYLILAVGNDGQFRRLCAILGMETNADDERYATNKARVANRNEVRAFISAATLKWNKGELLKACEANAVPVASVRLATARSISVPSSRR